MAKEVILTVWLHDDANPSIIFDSVNDVLRHPDIYPLIDDIEDEGWSWYND